jgi:predicted NUDIX family NTP pyrophosphohydrolase
LFRLARDELLLQALQHVDRYRLSKLVLAWAVEGDLGPDTAASDTYEMEWPPGSGRAEAFPEIERVAWFGLPEARRMIKATQVPFLDRFEASRPWDAPT